VRVLCLIVFFASDVAPPIVYWLSYVDRERRGSARHYVVYELA